MRNALKRVFQTGKLRGSFTEGSGSMIGYLAEEVFRYQDPSAEFVDDFDKDFILKAKSIDVKSRIAHARINEGFDFTMPCLKNDQVVDYYYFTAIYSHFEHAEILGYLSSEKFKKIRQKIEAGAPMPQGGFYKASGWRVFVRDLDKITKKEN
jgi:hypothetical protein